MAGLYRARLGGIEGLRLPPGPDDDPEHFDVFQNYEIEARDRDRLKAHLAGNGVGTLIQWGGEVVHMHKSLGFTVRLPDTEAVAARMLMLPINLTLLDEDVDCVCEQVRQFYGRA